MQETDNSFSSLVRDAVSLQTGLTSLTSDKNQLQNKIASLEATLMQTQLEHDDLKRRYEKLLNTHESEISSYSTKLKHSQKKLQRALEDAKSDKIEADSKSIQLSTSIARLSDKCASVEATLREKETENQVLRNSLNSQTKHLASLESVTNNLIKDVNFDSIKKALKNAEARLGSLASDVSSTVSWKEEVLSSLSALQLLVAEKDKTEKVIQPPKLEINLSPMVKKLSTSFSQTDDPITDKNRSYSPDDILNLTNVISSAVSQNSDMISTISASHEIFIKELSRTIGIGVKRGVSTLIDTETKNTIDEVSQINEKLSDRLSMATQEILELKEQVYKPSMRELSVQTEGTDSPNAKLKSTSTKKVSFDTDVASPVIEEINTNQQAGRKRGHLFFPVNM